MTASIGLTLAPWLTWTKFCSVIDMPMALISGASRNEPRSGRYATRSIVQPYRAAMPAANISVSAKASGTDVMPSAAMPSSAIEITTMETPVVLVPSA